MPILRDDPPLIVTAHLAPASFAIFDALRRRHFPPELNQVPAHVSLFHHLPGDELRQVLDKVRRACAGCAPMALLPTGVRSLGRGVAIGYEPGTLGLLRVDLARTFAAWLTPQDRQPFKPHVTIQNKVTPAAARALLAAMQATELPPCGIDGLAVWRYLGGPWEPVATCPFGAQ